jgi:hypothetical protein
MTGRQGRGRKQLLDELKGKRRYWKLKEEALDRTVWRTRFGRGYGSVVRQTNRLSEWSSDTRINFYVNFNNSLLKAWTCCLTKLGRNM